MQIRLYIDEDAMSRLLINGLVARGINVTTVDKECRTGLDDASQLEFATLKERVLYTCNISDFYHLHTEYTKQNKSHSGIIFVPQQRYSAGEQIRRLLNLIANKSAKEMINNVEFLSKW
jgi:hypothetical protein